MSSTATIDNGDEAVIERLRDAILDIDAHATPLGEDKDGFVTGGYVVSVGALHRALGVVGHSAPPCRLCSPSSKDCDSYVRTQQQIMRRIRAGWLPIPYEGDWWYVRPADEEGFTRWSEGKPFLVSVADGMPYDEMVAWRDNLHPHAPERSAEKARSGTHKPFDDDGVTYCGWRGGDGVHEGCGHLWPCPTVQAADSGQQITPPEAPASGSSSEGQQ